MTILVRAAGAPMLTIHQSDDLVLQLCRQPRAADKVVVTFDPIDWPLTQRPDGVDFLLRAGVDLVSVRMKRVDFQHEAFDPDHPASGAGCGVLRPL